MIKTSFRSTNFLLLLFVAGLLGVILLAKTFVNQASIAAIGTSSEPIITKIDFSQLWEIQNITSNRSSVVILGCPSNCYAELSTTHPMGALRDLIISTLIPKSLPLNHTYAVTFDVKLISDSDSATDWLLFDFNK